MKWIKDRYKVIKRFTGGNMSKVLLCIDFDSDDQQEVVIKAFEKTDSNFNTDLQKTLFLREVENLEKLEHDQIIRILDKGQDDDNNINFIVLEYFESDTLDKVMFRNVLSPKQKSKIILQLLDALVYAHSKQVIHRDLKPKNILINNSNGIKIIDFGISKLKNTFYSDYTLNNFGTPKYASWEQKNQKYIDFRSDIFSLGVILFELIWGHEVSQDNEIHIEIEQSDIEQEIKDVLKKMTEIDPASRFQSMSEVRSSFKVIFEKQRDGKLFGISFANSVIKNLLKHGYIEKESRHEASELIFSDLDQTITYLDFDRSDYRMDQKSYKLYGKQYEYTCVIDNKTKCTFTIVSIWFRNVVDLEANKERAIKVEGEWEVCEYLSDGSDFDDINDLINDFEMQKRQAEIKQSKDIKEKKTIDRWDKVLNLYSNELENQKNTLQYLGLERDASGDRLLVQVKNFQNENAFTDDQLLCMTSRKNIHHTKIAGYCIDVDNDKLIIQLSKDASPEDFASSGEISIDKRMVEISLTRQKKALKAVQYKEIKNPNISDILFDPSKAQSSELVEDLSFVSELDKSKQEAVEKAFQAKDIFLLQGPPGTGKTTFISELVNQIFSKNPESKILISSQSNVAVDHAMNKIKGILPSLSMLRIGRKDKLSLGAEKYTIDEQLEEWFEDIKFKCQNWLHEFKELIKIDEDIIEKYNAINDIENLRKRLEEIDIAILEAESNYETIKIKYALLKKLLDDIQTISARIQGNSKNIKELELNTLIDTFKKDFISIGEKFVNQLDEMSEISEQKMDLELKIDRYINEKSEVNKSLKNRQTTIKVETPEQYFKLRVELTSKIETNKKDYEFLSKIEGIQNEWVSRLATDEKMIDVLIKRTSVIGSTCLGIASLQYTGDVSFDWVIIDEAGKATPPELLVPMA